MVGGYQTKLTATSALRPPRYAQKPGCPAWGDSSNADVVCDLANAFVTRATGGYYLYTDPAGGAGVHVSAVAARGIQGATAP